MRFSLSIISLLSLAIAIQAQSISQFISKYKSIESKLYERYTFNKRVVVNKGHSFGLSRGRTVVITSRDSTIIEYETPYDGAYVEYHTPDNGFSVRNAKKKAEITFPVEGKLVEFGFPYTGFSFDSPQTWPMSAYRFQGGGTIGDLIRGIELNDPRISKLKIDSVGKREFRGRSVMEVVISGEDRPNGSIFLDPERLIYVGFRYQHERYEQYEGLVTYDEKSGEPYPLPVKFERWKFDYRGKPLDSDRDVIVEYTDYTPSRDEFDVTKRFGLTPPPAKPRLLSTLPGIATRTRLRLFWIGVTAIVVAMIVSAVLVINKNASAKGKPTRQSKSISRKPPTP